MNKLTRKWLKRWFDRKVDLMVSWGFDYDNLKDLWKLVDDRKTYHENKEMLDDEMHSQIPYNIKWIPVDQLKPLFERDIGDLTELKRTVRKQNILEPLIVREIKTMGLNQEKYEVVCGHRRLEAAKQTRLTRVPCVVRNIVDREAKAFNAIENLHRKNRNPIEEGKFYKKCIDSDFSDQKDLASFIGKSQGYISNRIRLLRLSEKNQSYVAQGKLTPEHGMKLLMVSDPDLQIELGDEAVAKRLTTRQLGNIIKKIEEGQKVNIEQLIKEILQRSPCELIDLISKKIMEENDNCARCRFYRRCRNLSYKSAF